MAYLTIPGFSKMSKQRIFNKAVAHIAVTRTMSYSETSCKYGGTGCNAAPLLLPDKHRAADGIGQWSSLVTARMVPPTNADFIQQLQNAHDSCSKYVPSDEFMAQWKSNMRSLAEHWNLSTSTLDKVAV